MHSTTLPTDSDNSADVLEVFSGPTRSWFEASFAAPTPVQCLGWPPIARGEHTLLCAPTGSGKTLAAFLWAIDRLSRPNTDATSRGFRVVYVSPLKALAYDIEKNLRAPLAGIQRAAAETGASDIDIFIRTGDTPRSERRRMKRHPDDILITTPESLYLILGSAARETLRSVETVILDEIHAVAARKRGTHLALSLERLSHLADGEPQRIGLSATQRPLERVAGFLGGDREVTIVDTSEPPNLDVRLLVPVTDMRNPGRDAEDPRGGRSLLADDDPEGRARARSSIWPSLHGRLLDLIREHRTTICFVNNRRLCERLVQALNEKAGEEIVRPHHGSLSHRKRTEIEEGLKRGTLKGIIATSSLELGIDMGTVDLVLQVESPRSVARGLQRIGRAGHGVGEVSRGRLFPKHAADLLESGVILKEMQAGRIEPIRIPRNPLDVLAQQIVAMCAVEDWPLDRLEALLHRTGPYGTLTRELLVSVLDMLSGRFPSDEFADLRPRIVWDRTHDVLRGRRGSKMVALVNAGTIPDRGLYGVFLADGGTRVGELDEEMVYECRVGETFLLGASSWRIREITRDRVIVEPAPGEPGKMPFWRGAGPGRPIELGRAVGRFTRQVAERLEEEESLLADLQEAGLDEKAAENLLAYVRDQIEATGVVPTDSRILIEWFRDQIGDWRICILSPFGGRLHAPWALAVEALLERQGVRAQAIWTDDGICFRLPDADDLPALELFCPQPEEIESLLLDHLGQSPLFASHFRENAGRALLLPKRRPGERTPLWAQRLKSQNLLEVAGRYPSFPIVLETYRECLADVFDMEALREVLGAIRSREIRVREVETPAASPFARSLVFAFVAAYLYEGDAPLAERRAQALTLDRDLLRDLLGREELRELLDAGVIDQVEAELQHRAEDRRARHPDALHDLLRRLGDLRTGEVVERCDGDAEEWLGQLADEGRALRVRMAGEERWIAIEDAGRYRDALGVAPAPGVPEVYLESVDNALATIFRRWARTHAPFPTRALTERYGLARKVVEARLRRLVERNRLLHGPFRPDGTEPEWCDPDVLRRCRRRSLALLRDAVAPIEDEALGRFLPRWQGIGRPGRGTDRLEEVLVGLEGAPISFRALEESVLPARLKGFHAGLLDQLGARGRIVWVGRGALGSRDGRLAIYRRERAPFLLPEPGERPTGGIGAELLERLESRGAAFFSALQTEFDSVTPERLLEQLWDLVWAGHVTNDTFGPLRALRAPKGGGRRSRIGAFVASAAGRWSATADLRSDAVSDTEKAHARVEMLLDRYGIVSREAALAEGIEGGFQTLYPVLRAMEEAGTIRRGYFIEGLSGAQFATVGAVDRLRSDTGAEVRAFALSAVDPANPYGGLLGWPETDAGRPRRVAGAWVVLVDGRLALFLEGRRASITTFIDPDEDEALVRAAARALDAVAECRKGRLLRVESIDGASARQSLWTDTLKEAGFRADYKGLTLDLRRKERDGD